MSGRRVRMPSLCQCNTCSSRRSRKETRSSAAVNQNTQRLRPALSSRPNPRSPSPRPTARSQPAPLSRPAPSANDVTGRRRSSVESESPALVAKVSFKWKGWQTMSNLENEHWKLVVTILALLVIVWLFPGARGETIKVGDGHELQVTKSESAFLIDSKAYQINLCSSVEYFSKKPISQLREKIGKWRKLAEQWDEPKEVTLDKIDAFCPKVGGGSSAGNPGEGPFPKLLNFQPRGNTYLAVATKSEDTILCSYFFKPAFISGGNRVGNAKADLKKLFSKMCQNQLKQGMIFPKKDFVTHVFKTKQPTSILACAELCINQYERSVLNSTCLESGQRYAECPSEIPKCHYWSFNPKTGFCLMYLNKQVWPHERKASTYDKLNEKSGLASDGWTGPVYCGDWRQKEKIWIRSGENRDEWIPMKGSCSFQEEPKNAIKVYANCRETSSMMQMLVSGMEDKMSRFNKRYKLTPSMTDNDERSKKSPLAMSQHLISPAVQKFLISAMSSVMPKMAGFSSIVMGPLIGTFLYLTATLMSFVVQLASENHQKILNKGIVEIQDKDWGDLNQKWEVWKTSNLLKVPGIEDPGFFDRNYPLSGLNNVSEELKATLASFGEILEQGNPILPRIVQEMGRIPFTFLVLDAGEYIKKVYFFTKTNKKVPKLQISVFLSLDHTVPLLEGVVSGTKQTESPTIQCADIFRRSQKATSPCFDKNALGSSSQAKFLIGKQLYIFKILGQKVVQIQCPETSLTTFSSGIMIFLASSSCKIHIGGNLFFEGEKSKMGSFKMILETQMNASKVVMPLPHRLQAKLDNLQQEWSWRAIWILISTTFGWLVVLFGTIGKIYTFRKKRNQPVVRYKQPTLLPMKSLKSSRFQIDDIKETKTNK